MRSVPKFFVGSFKNTLSVALEEITRSDDEVNQERGWKLCFPGCFHTAHQGVARSRRPSWLNGSGASWTESGSG